MSRVTNSFVLKQIMKKPLQVFVKLLVPKVFSPYNLTEASINSFIEVQFGHFSKLVHFTLLTIFIEAKRTSLLSLLKYYISTTYTGDGDSLLVHHSINREGHWA